MFKRQLKNGSINYESIEEKKERLRFDRSYKRVKDENLYVDSDYYEKVNYEKLNLMKAHSHCYTYAFHSLGDIRGKRILDLGCGSGVISVILAKNGAIVEGIDISSEAIEIARKRSYLNDVANFTHFQEMSFYDLKFPQNYFDRIFGFAVLHHANDKKLLSETSYRVLKPGGKIVFAEPFGNSETLEKLRLIVPVPVQEEDKSHWKEQIKYKDLEVFQDNYSMNYKEFQFFSRLDRIIKSKKIIEKIGLIDLKLLENFSFLKPYARDIVIILDKK